MNAQDLSPQVIGIRCPALVVKILPSWLFIRLGQ
jgi:hypothetical protein